MNRFEYQARGGWESLVHIMITPPLLPTWRAA